MSRLTLLGTGTCQLQEHRRASSVLWELDGLRVVYDLGRGIADRLAGLGFKQDDLQYVVFSHFHPDHVSDLVPFLHASAWSQSDPRTTDLHLYGPPGLENLVQKILELFGPQTLQRESWRLHVHEVTGDRLTLEGYDFAFEHLPPAGNRGLKIELGPHTVAVTGDSNFHAQEVAFLKGVDLGIFDSGHLSDDEIVELAVGSGARRLICSHVYRELDIPALQERAQAKGFGGELIMGRDLMVLDLSSPEVSILGALEDRHGLR